MSDRPLAAPGSLNREFMAQEIHALAVSRGWWEGPESERVERLLDWIVEEAEEARTAYRERGLKAWYSTDTEGLQKPEGFAAELADIELILGDLTTAKVPDFPAAVREKLDYAHIRKFRRDARGGSPSTSKVTGIWVCSPNGSHQLCIPYPDPCPFCGAAPDVPELTS